MAIKNHLHQLKNASREAFNAWVKNDKIELDLSGEDLGGMILDGYEFSRANLIGTIFRKTSLVETRFLQAKIDGADFEEADLHKADFNTAKGTRCNFRKSNLSQVFFGQATLHFADFTDAIFEFGGPMFERVDFDDAILSNLNLDRRDFVRCSFRNATLKKLSLRGAKIVDCNLSEADISESDFFEASIHSTNVSGIVGAELAKNLESVAWDNSVYFEHCKRRWYEYLDWERIRLLGRLPLFGISTTAIGILLVYGYFVDWYDTQIEAAKAAAIKSESPYVLSFANEHLHTLPVPSNSVLLLSSFVLLFIASTIYLCFCPSRIKHFTKDVWRDELGHPLIHYWPLSWKYRRIRLACFSFYVVGAGLAIVVLAWKLVILFQIILKRL